MSNKSDSFGTDGVIGKGVSGVPSGGCHALGRKMLGRAAGKGGWAGCSLDPGGCLSLQQILASFTAPISEEHAWAVIHQVKKKQQYHASSLEPPIFGSEMKPISNDKTKYLYQRTFEQSFEHQWTSPLSAKLEHRCANKGIRLVHCSML